MNNENFYKNIKSINNLDKISKEDIYTDFPEDWYVLISDIKASTKAIEEGRYKEVNMLGAISIISILNLNKNLELPFVFGGDGAFILIPPSLYKKALQALIAIKELAKDSYKLDLRIGVIPIKSLYEEKKKLKISKYEVSKNFYQAIIKGGSLEYCDYLLKSNKVEIKEKKQKDFKLDLSGLECRWETISSPKDQIITLIIKAKEEKDYTNILNKLDIILGNKEQRHPLSIEHLKLSFDNKKLEVEASIYEKKKNFKRYLLLLKFKAINLLGKFLMDLKINQWGEYKNRIIKTADTEKFDDLLRMTISANKIQVKNLENYLQKEFENNKIFYGLHKSDSSLMTCLIFERHGNHVHFIDATKGGYALASKMLKGQIEKSF